MIILLLLVLALVLSTAFTFFSSEVYGAFIRSNPQNDITSFGFHRSTNMTTPKAGDVFEITINATWFCPPSEFERRIELIDPYPENNCRIIDGNNAVQCIGYDGEAQITYLLEVIDDNPDTFMLADPFTAVYIDGAELQFRSKPVIDDCVVPKPVLFKYRH
jgi:hypothetical protein